MTDDLRTLLGDWENDVLDRLAQQLPLRERLKWQARLDFLQRQLEALCLTVSSHR